MDETFWIACLALWGGHCLCVLHWPLWDQIPHSVAQVCKAKLSYFYQKLPLEGQAPLLISPFSSFLTDPCRRQVALRVTKSFKLSKYCHWLIQHFWSMTRSWSFLHRIGQYVDILAGREYCWVYWATSSISESAVVICSPSANLADFRARNLEAEGGKHRRPLV
jgi:hypothetical protein